MEWPRMNRACLAQVSYARSIVRSRSRLVVGAFLEDADREPGQTGRVSNQEHRACAIEGRQWRQYVVDGEVAVRGELHAGKVRIALGKGRVRFANESGDHELARRPSRV